MSIRSSTFRELVRTFLFFDSLFITLVEMGRVISPSPFLAFGCTLQSLLEQLFLLYEPCTLAYNLPFTILELHFELTDAPPRDAILFFELLDSFLNIV